MATVPDQSFIEAIDLEGRLIRASNFLLDFWWAWLVIGALAWLGLKIRSQHALVAKLDERADAAFGDVDALLVERRTLIGNLVEVVRGFAQREQDMIRDVLHARIDALEAIGEAAIRTETQVANVLQNLFTVGDSFPELASAVHYSTLRHDLIRIEERITAARKFYNLAVEELNSVRRAFPGNLVSYFQAMPAREKFSLGERRDEFAEAAKISL